MRINNSTNNFGSIQLTKEANQKGFRTLSLEILEGLKTNMLPDKTSEEIRKKLNINTVNIIPNKEEGMKIIAKTLQEELSILEKIKKDFDPYAKFINDFETTELNILG